MKRSFINGYDRQISITLMRDLPSETESFPVAQLEYRFGFRSNFRVFGFNHLNMFKLCVFKLDSADYNSNLSTFRYHNTIKYEMKYLA